MLQGVEENQNIKKTQKLLQIKNSLIHVHDKFMQVWLFIISYLWILHAQRLFSQWDFSQIPVGYVQ